MIKVKKGAPGVHLVMKILQHAILWSFQFISKKKSLPYLLITKIKFFMFQEEELRVVNERLEVIKRDKLNNQV